MNKGRKEGGKEGRKKEWQEVGMMERRKDRYMKENQKGRKERVI